MIVIKNILCCSLVALLSGGCMTVMCDYPIVGEEYIDAINAIENGINPVNVSTKIAVNKECASCKNNNANDIASDCCVNQSSSEKMANLAGTPKTLEYIHDEKSTKTMNAQNHSKEVVKKGVTPYIGFAASLSAFNADSKLKSTDNAGGDIFNFSAKHSGCAFDLPIFIGIKGYDPFYWATEIGLGFLNQNHVDKHKPGDHLFNGLAGPAPIHKDLKFSVRDLGFISLKLGESFDKLNVYGALKIGIQDVTFGEEKNNVNNDKGAGTIKSLYVCPGIGVGYNISNICFRCEYFYKINTNHSNKIIGIIAAGFPEIRYGDVKKDSRHVFSVGVEISL